MVERLRRNVKRPFHRLNAVERDVLRLQRQILAALEMCIRASLQIFGADVQRSCGIRLTVKIRKLRGSQLDIALAGGARPFAAGETVGVGAQRFRPRKHTVLRQCAGFDR
ncbi:hypothetical protein D3C80_900220 [compost metagenome]